MDIKICSKCSLGKELKFFPYKNKKKGIRHGACTECWKDIRRESYNKNKGVTLIRNKRNREKIYDWYVEYKSTLKCSRCPENHPACLDFHHTDPKEKNVEISKLIGNTFSVKYIMKEIKKCEVLCSNCHRKLHYNKNKMAT